MRINSPEDLNYNYSYSAQSRRKNFRKRQRKQQLIRRIIIFILVLILLLVSVKVGSIVKKKFFPKQLSFTLFQKDKDKPGKKKPEKEPGTKKPAKFTPIPTDAATLPADVITTLNEQAAKDAKIAAIVTDYTAYPVELLQLLAHNLETADFVSKYPTDKSKPIADSIGTVTAGSVPHLLQWDTRWGYAPYGDGLLAVNGCGPTTVAMVAAGLTGDASITPYKIAQYAEANGYYVNGNGSSWDLIRNGAQPYGVTATELILDEGAIKKQLQAGHPIICSMRPGDFTTTGHFIVLTGYEDGKLHVLDPNSKEKSAKPWTYDQLAPQINNLWAFSK